ncbi:MAG: preprotein translocase subunit SecA [Candidatus Omnitrophica bacterium]|nr:preprotein translocase subunit SecA [Candidatus Omnitrophota bacterium]
MFKHFLLNRQQHKINRLDPKVNIVFHPDIPLPSARETGNWARLVGQTNAYEQELREKPDEFFKEKTLEYKELIKEKTKDVSESEYLSVAGKLLDEILPFYFAMVREASRRTLKMRHFDVQILGGIVLHNNRIAEMTTGEGKTLVATLSASLNALTGKGVHLVTVNDYLARRDSEWMGPIYRFLGLTCGVIQQDMNKKQRTQEYLCDIVYGTNNEFGFDYLRDNMSTHPQELVQRGHFYAVVDEVDSILVDEARTPLIISGPSEVSIDKYYTADKVVRQLKTKMVISRHDTKEGVVILKNTDGSESRFTPEELEANYEAIIEEKTHNAYPTKRGEEKCEQLLTIQSVTEDTPDPYSNSWIHYISQGLRAHYLFKKDKEYIVKDGKVVIVDEFTGRLMPGRRWSDGLHQAVEAKEKINIQEESQTLATVTLQNYFRMYKKLSGMTGTAYTEANEFRHIYKLDVVAIPTNRPLKRMNNADRIYKNKKAKFNAVVNEVCELHTQGRPVLVGTASIEDSEIISGLLTRKGVPHNVLNAKYHEREAHIVAQAGRRGQVTIATNMAGRGTDIILGGNIDFFVKDLLQKNEIIPEHPDYTVQYQRVYQDYKEEFETEHNQVVELGGLHVIGTQRHEARRIDNQLRGRSGRQGDPGSSRFYVSLEDDLMRMFGSDRIYFLMDRLGFPEDEPIEHALVNRSIEMAQKKVEAHNFEIRKQLLQYDNVMNKQREVIYAQRQEVMAKDDIKEEILQMIEDVIVETVALHAQTADWESLLSWLHMKFGVRWDIEAVEGKAEGVVIDSLKDILFSLYEQKEKELSPDTMRYMEKIASLWIIDARWKEHLLLMDSLKEGIYLRGYAHVDPLIEYQKESYGLFNEMMFQIKESIIEYLLRTKLTAQKELVTVFDNLPKAYIHSHYSSLQKEEKSQKTVPHAITPEQKVGRNEPCPCGSGKKYKKCCGR